jgi:hypothetical protein
MGSAVLALNGSMVPLVAHDVIRPTVLPEIRPMAPVLIVPSAAAPPVGIVPGTAVVDVAPIAGGLRVDRACCAKVELQPNNTMVAVMRIKLRIEASCV